MGRHQKASSLWSSQTGRCDLALMCFFSNRASCFYKYVLNVISSHKCSETLYCYRSSPERARIDKHRRTFFTLRSLQRAVFKSSCIHYAVCKSHTYTHKHDITAVKKEDFLLHACRHAALPESICSHSDSEKHTRWVGGRVCEASWRMIGFTLTSTIRHFTYTIQHIHKLNGWMRAAVKWLPPNIHNLMGVITQHDSGESIFI